MQGAEPPLPTRHFVGRGLLYLYLEVGPWRPAIHVSPEPRLQFVTGPPDSPKTEAKGVILVRGPWYETPSSPDLLFVLNQSMSFPSVFKLWDLYVGAFLRVYPLRSRILLLLFFLCREKLEG